MITAEENEITTILEQMKEAQQALTDSPEVSSEYLDNQIQEWRTQLTKIIEQQSQRAREDKEAFITFIAHELRTPMTSIRGYSDMLAKGVVGPLTPSQLDFIQTIIKNTERMQILISDLQDITRLETRRLHTNFKPTDLTQALAAALDTVQEYIDERNQELAVDIPEEFPAVYADSSRLAQILTELLRNASKYTPEQGQIRVEAVRKGDFALCSVSDTGFGISPQDQAKLFTKFFRSDDPAIRDRSGTGLGLCVVKGLVELQGGNITVKSQLGQGTKVTFTMSLASEE